MNLQQWFFAAYVASLYPACRAFFQSFSGVWEVIDNTEAGQVKRQAMFEAALKEPWAPGQLDAEIMVNAADPLWTYNERASVGAIFGVPPANEPGLGENPGYAFPNATPQLGQQAYPTSALPNWLPIPTEAEMSVYAASKDEIAAKSWLAKYFPTYKAV